MLCLQSWRSSLYTANPNTSLDSPPHFHFWRFLTFDLHLLNQPSGKHMVMRYGCCCALLIIQLPLNLRSSVFLWLQAWNKRTFQCRAKIEINLLVPIQRSSQDCITGNLLAARLGGCCLLLLLHQDNQLQGRTTAAMMMMILVVWWSSRKLLLQFSLDNWHQNPPSCLWESQNQKAEQRTGQRLLLAVHSVILCFFFIPSVFELAELSFA